MSTPLGWDARAGGAGTLRPVTAPPGSGTGCAAGAAGWWNILVNSPSSPGGVEPEGAAEGAAGLRNARVNSPGWDVVAGCGASFGAGATTGAGAWRS
jgi:hypothetical protein